MGAKAMLNNAIEYFLPGDCFEQFLKLNFFYSLFFILLCLHSNIFSENCMPILISRLLGVGITLGSSFLLVPQILKINKAKSGRGISLAAQSLGLLSAAGTAAYSYEKKFIFGYF